MSYVSASIVCIAHDYCQLTNLIFKGRVIIMTIFNDSILYSVYAYCMTYTFVLVI